jgi:ADP-heptose:LPS heptosyltransferase
VVKRAGIATHDRVVFPLELGSEERRCVDQLLKGRGVDEARLIAIAPAAKRSFNIWPAERFIEVGQHLASKGFTVVVTGGGLDAELCGKVADAISGAINLAGRTSLRESCEVLRRCWLLICNDSGVQHLASAVGTPCISIFSAWQMPRKWYPYGPRNVVLRKWVACHTCLRETCPNDNLCIRLVETGEVTAAANAMLQRIAEGSPETPPGELAAAEFHKSPGRTAERYRFPGSL